MSSLNGFLNKKVAVITTDGKYFVGVLEGYDHLTNLIITQTEERVLLREGEENIIESLGLYVIRGDLVSCVGLVDEEVDKSIDWSKVHAQPLMKTKKSIR